MGYLKRGAADAADIVLIGTEKNTQYVLLIERGWDPFKGCWALPGGYVDPGEKPRQAAYRELREETSIKLSQPLHGVGAYNEPGRDPRGPVRSIAFTAAVPSLLKATAGDDAKNVRWVPVADALTGKVQLAFDHERILRDALKVLAKQQR